MLAVCTGWAEGLGFLSEGLRSFSKYRDASVPADKVPLFPEYPLHVGCLRQPDSAPGGPWMSSLPSNGKVKPLQ